MNGTTTPITERNSSFMLVYFDTRIHLTKTATIEIRAYLIFCVNEKYH
jgi:hypothetical protein